MLPSQIGQAVGLFAITDVDDLVILALSRARVRHRRPRRLVVYIVTFLALVAVWCAASFPFATCPRVARALTRWGHVLLAVVLIALGLLILIEGGAFGL